MSLIVISLLLGWFLVDYVLMATMGVDIHWGGDVLISLVASPAVLPSALVTFILELCGVPSPFFGN